MHFFGQKSKICMTTIHETDIPYENNTMQPIQNMARNIPYENNTMHPLTNHETDNNKMTKKKRRITIHELVKNR